MAKIFNTIVLVLTAGIVAAYEAGFITGDNAFFGAILLGAGLIASQLMRFEGETIDTALRQIFSGSGNSQAGTMAYASFMGVMVLSSALVVQVLLGF